MAVMMVTSAIAAFKRQEARQRPHIILLSYVELMTTVTADTETSHLT